MTKIIDSRFVGKWKGSDEGRVIPGQTNFWLMNRKSDGTFEIFFETHFENGAIEQSSEIGIWYVIGNIFCEYRESDNHTDRYQYEFLSPQIIQYIEIDPQNQSPYMFKDFKLMAN